MMRFIWLLHDGKWSMRCIVYPPFLVWTGHLVCSNDKFKVLIDG